MRGARRPVIVVVSALVFVGALVGLVLTFAPLSGETREPCLQVETYVVPEFMTAVYKAYGGSDPDRWLARTVVKNVGDEPVRGLRIEYQVAGYTQTTSVGEYPVVLPGQTVRDYCYPVFAGEEMAEIASETPAELSITYRCDGMDQPVIRSESFDFLGHNEWVRTDLPEDECLTFQDWLDNDEFLAVFVTHTEPVTQELAKRLTAGIFTATDEGAMEAVSAVFYGLRDSQYRYVSEPDSYWTDGFAQHVQLPRETIAHQGGNCVDLSVLVSALLEAVDVQTYLTLSSGHCQVSVVLPEDGAVIPVEATLVGVPTASLQDAYDAGYATYEEQSAQGTYLHVDVEGAWSLGMVPSL
jgi:transglutaminase-like putative cysteine protease